MTFRYHYLFSILMLGLLTFACGGEAAQEMEEKAEEATDKMETMADEVITSGGISLAPMPATHDFPNAKLNEWAYKDGTFTYAVSDYEFAAQTPDAESLMCANSGKGQHAHLIVNNEPYMAKYTPSFEVELPDGTHHIMTFLSRSYHEAIKNGTAFRAVKAEVKDNSFASVNDIEEPMLFYSRPKGSYKGKRDTEKVMLDFYPVNAELSADGYYVQAIVNGASTFKITEWQPYFLSGLPMGENTVELALMKDGKLVEAPLNPVSRTFTLEALPTEM